MTSSDRRRRRVNHNYYFAGRGRRVYLINAISIRARGHMHHALASATELHERRTLCPPHTSAPPGNHRRRHIPRKKGSPYSITERRVPELIPVLVSQPAGDVSHKPGGRLPLLSARPAVTPATLKRAATNFAAW